MIQILKAFTIFLVFASGLLFLTACTGNPSHSEVVQQPENTVSVQITASPTGTTEQEQPTQTSTPTTEPEPESNLGIEPGDLSGVEIDFWHPWVGERAEIMNALVNEFNESNEWGIRVVQSGKGDIDMLWEQVAESIQSGNAPQLTVGYLHQILSLASSEPVIDQEIYLKDPVWGLSEDEQADFFTVFLNSDLSGTRRAGFPAMRFGHVLFYNTTWAQELGFKNPPQTPEELGKQACTAANANLIDDNPENDGSGGSIISTQYTSTLGWLKAFNSPVVNQDNSNYQFDLPETEEAFQFLLQLYDESCAWLPESDYVEEEFAKREGLFSSSSLTAIPHQIQAFSRLENNDSWTILPFPSPTGDAVMPVYGPSYAILPSTPEDQLAAWLFIRWLTQPENDAKWVEANGSLPLRASTLEILAEYRQAHPLWSTTVDAISQGVSEPPFASWGQVRWALHDATTQLYRYYFSTDGIPEMVRFLQATASDLNEQFDP